MSRDTQNRAGLTRRAFIYLTSLVAMATTRMGGSYAAANEDVAQSKVSAWNSLLKEVQAFPLMSALFGRYSRRFG